MKVAHFAVFGPNRCGLYHTAKELVLAERLVGIDAQFIAVDENNEVSVHTDGSFTTKELDWAYDADVLVRHTSIPTHIQSSGIPVVMCLHGRPESSLRLEEAGNAVITAVANKAADARYKAFVTFWPEYTDIWRNLTGDKIHCVEACVDMEEYKPVPRQWDTPSILISDMWRDDVTPFNMIFAAHRFAQRHPGTKVHIVGLSKELTQPVTLLLKDMNADGVLGDVGQMTKDIKSWYAKCNMLITPHVIATRSIREALASGMKVTAGSGCRFTSFKANPMDVDSYAEAMASCWRHGISSIGLAEESFGMKRAGEDMKSIFEDVLVARSDAFRKVFVDIGAHLGESVRRFYREVPDAHEYEIYCFEPDAETFKLLDKQIGHIKNVDLINAAADLFDGMTEYYPAANASEGGTLMNGKLTGGVRYNKPMTVECIEFSRWWFANKGDYNVIKINAEGAEYPLMSCMLAKKIVADKLFIQLHAHKFKHGEERQKMQQTEARFVNNYQGKMYLKNKGFYPFHAE